MKRSMCLMLFVFLLQNTLEAQKIWQYEHTGSFATHDRILKYCGDTIIESENWKILEFGELNFENSEEVSTQIIGFVKETNYFVEYIDSQNGHRRILYDYNLNVSDTIVIQFESPTSEGRFLVEAKDSIMLNGDSRRLLTLRDLVRPHNFDVWVEGIGSVRKSFLAPGALGSPHNWSRITCFQEESNTSIWGDSIVGDCKIDSIIVLCSILSSTDEPSASINMSTSSYPNPFETILNIDIGESLNKFEIYDLSGQMVYQENIILEKKHLSLNLEQLNSGIYAILYYKKNGEIEYQPVIKVQ